MRDAGPGLVAAGPSSDATPIDDLLLLVGRLNYAWTNTESLLIHLIAGLARTDKDSAVIVFLTLNTGRARIDLVERLAKLDRTDAAEKAGVLDITARLTKLSGLRNRFSHSMYAFDQETGTTRTIMMRIADRKDAIRVGRSDVVDVDAIHDVEAAIRGLAALNHDIWTHIGRFAYPT